MNGFVLSGPGGHSSHMLTNPAQGYFVYAGDVNAGEKLLGLQGPKCQIARLDITSVESIWEFKAALGDQKIDVLLNVAG